MPQPYGIKSFTELRNSLDLQRFSSETIVPPTPRPQASLFNVASVGVFTIRRSPIFIVPRTWTWLRKKDSNLRPTPYEGAELPLLYSAIRNAIAFSTSLVQPQKYSSSNISYRPPYILPITIVLSFSSFQTHSPRAIFFNASAITNSFLNKVG